VSRRRRKVGKGETEARSVGVTERRKSMRARHHAVTSGPRDAGLSRTCWRASARPSSALAIASDASLHAPPTGNNPGRQKRELGARTIGRIGICGCAVADGQPVHVHGRMVRPARCPGNAPCRLMLTHRQGTRRADKVILQRNDGTLQPLLCCVPRAVIRTARTRERYFARVEG